MLNEPSNSGTLNTCACQTNPRTPVRAIHPGTKRTQEPASAAKSLQLALLVMLTVPAYAAYPNGYTYCKVVTTQHTMVSGSSDLANYPLTVILTDPDLKTVANGGLVNDSNGYDIGFYSNCAPGGTALKWEVESYSPTTGALVAHVLRPTLSANTDDTIAMFYGGAFSSFQSTATAVWDSNYKGVWHLANGAGLSVADSTSNGVNGANSNAASGTGRIDGSASFNGASARISIPGSSAWTPSQLTIEHWLKPDAGWTSAGSHLGTEISYRFNGSAGTTTNFVVFTSNNSWYSAGTIASSTTTLDAGTWYHVVWGL